MAWCAELTKSLDPDRITTDIRAAGTPGHPNRKELYP